MKKVRQQMRNNETSFNEYTNEKTNELVSEFQEGNKSVLPELWENCVRFIRMKAKKYISNQSKHKRDFLDDMVNESYEYFLKAVKNYKKESGSNFISYLSYHLHRPFETVIYGGTTVKKKKDVLNDAISLDVPISSDPDENLSLKDIIADAESLADFEAIESENYWASLRPLLLDAIKNVRSPIGKQILLYMYRNNCKLPHAIHQLTSFKNYGLYRREYNKAIIDARRRLNHSANRKQMELLGLDRHINYYGQGFRTYKSRGFTSGVEAAVIRRDKSMERFDFYFNVK